MPVRRHRGRGRPRPRLAPPRQAQPTAEAARQQQPGAAPRRKTVLIVEDNATIGGLLVGLLREEGYRALRAWDSKEAIKMARDRRPDLIVLELSLPYLDGIRMLPELRAQPEMKDAPMILVAGNTMQLPDEQRAEVTELMVKPVDIDRLINSCRKAVGDPEYEIPEKDYSSTVDLHAYSW